VGEWTARLAACSCFLMPVNERLAARHEVACRKLVVGSEMRFWMVGYSYLIPVTSLATRAGDSTMGRETQS